MENGEAAKFLERDFNQCFAQMRHYDSQIWNVCRFAFTAYIAILGTAISMYQYSVLPPSTVATQPLSRSNQTA